MMKRCLFASLVFTATFGVVGVFAQLNTNTPSASELRQMIQDAERGDAVVQARLGRCYSAGRGVERDYALAVKWTRLAAEQGNPQGQNNLGAYYIKGQGVETNNVVAAEWFRKSAEQGDAWGQLSLSACHYRGQGVTRNLQKAYGWCLLAEKGDKTLSTAELELGVKDMVRILKGELSSAERQAAERWVKNWKPKAPK